MICASALTVGGLIGCDFLEVLKSYHKLPSEALEALRQQWAPIAAVQLLGRASEPEAYNYEIAAIFQSYMVSLLHGSLCCHALEKESAKRKANAKRHSKWSCCALAMVWCLDIFANACSASSNA